MDLPKLFYLYQVILRVSVTVNILPLDKGNTIILEDPEFFRIKKNLITELFLKLLSDLIVYNQLITRL